MDPVATTPDAKRGENEINNWSHYLNAWI